jgi:hypothetical protein
MIIRTSERQSLKRCPARWWWNWRKGLTPNAVDTKLWFGQGIHVALADWYLPGFDRGPAPAKTWLKFVRDEERYIKNRNALIDENAWMDARNLGGRMLLAYVDHYGKDDDWDVIATEQMFEVTIKMPDGTPIIYTGTFDGVYRDRKTGLLWLMEHKTASGLPHVGYLELDDQAGSYFAFAPIVLKQLGLMREDEKLEGIMYNFLRKGLPDDRPVDELGRALNQDGSISKRQPTKLFMRHPVWRSERQRAKMIDNVISEAELMMAYRSNQLKITKTPTRDCQWDCSFFAMCQLHESGDDWQEYRDAMFKVRDPYSDHRLALKDAGM